MNNPDNSEVRNALVEDNPNLQPQREGNLGNFLPQEDEPKNQTNTNTEETEYRPEEGLSPTAWRNLKIILVVGGIVGNLIMRFGLVENF